jgi:hypothetical protein
VHLSWAIEISPATKSIITHFDNSVRVYCSANLQGKHSIYTYVFIYKF